MEKFDMTATTFFGLEGVLAEELTKIGASDIKLSTRAVVFRGDIQVLYRANFWLRTALKILVPIKKFKAFNDKELYEEVIKINWQDYMAVSDTFAIDCTASGPVFTHSKYAALKCKDAIADYFRNKRGRRPSVDTEYPDLRINIHIYNSDITVSLDSTGIPMSKRGYKVRQTEAPVNEVLAAGILKLALWQPSEAFTDPMCGSGTFPIEAALMAMNIAPGNFRHFAVEKWRNFDSSIWAELKKEQKDIIKTKTENIICGFDIDVTALDASCQNATKAGVENFIDFNRKDFFDNPKPAQEGFLIMNPPYGERLETENEIGEFYKNIGDTLKNNYEGYKAWILSGNLPALKTIGLHPKKKIKLFNGPLECKLECFEIYSGSKKINKQTIAN
ncbi:MAG: methyltransferase [Bacteroidales bacterium]|nr:methyltransferase [Bacteroidales bacterium]